MKNNRIVSTTSFPRLPLGLALGACCAISSISLFADDRGDGAAAKAGRAPEAPAVYAKVILPMEGPAAGGLPIEDWIIEKLKGRGELLASAAGPWIRLKEKSDPQGVDIWNGTFGGKGVGCPAHGHILERGPKQVVLEFGGFAPVFLEVEGTRLPTAAGSRGLAVVGEGFAYIALHVGQPQGRVKQAAGAAD